VSGYTTDSRVDGIHQIHHDWSERKRLSTVPGIIRYVALTELVRYATAGLSGKGLPTVTIIIRYSSVDGTARYATMGPSDKELSTETAIIRGGSIDGTRQICHSGTEWQRAAYSNYYYKVQ
jgi:hypothetical protein